MLPFLGEEQDHALPGLEPGHARNEQTPRADGAARDPHLLHGTHRAFHRQYGRQGVARLDPTAAQIHALLVQDFDLANEVGVLAQVCQTGFRLGCGLETGQSAQQGTSQHGQNRGGAAHDVSFSVAPAPPSAVFAISFCPWVFQERSRRSGGRKLSLFLTALVSELPSAPLAE
ncbi:MAG: hypothetical protein CMJ94_06065 [Planctomycetes bacterium]|nr:hypothetical protein [Planctomycetota bacterium]